MIRINAGAALMLVCSALRAQPGVLVLNETNAPPYSNAERTGFFDVVAAEAFRRAKLDLRIVTVPAGRSLLLSDSGAADGELNRNPAIEKLYPNLVRVPEALGEMTFVAFGRGGSIPANFDAFRGRAVGLLRGWKIYERAMAGRDDVIAASDLDQLFRLLQFERIDVALYERDMGRAYLRAHAIGSVRDLEPPLFVLDEFIYLHKSRAALVPALTAALRSMKRDGAYQRAYRERFQPGGDEPPR